MRIPNTACPQCKQELTPRWEDLIPERRGGVRWHCKHCGEEIYVDGVCGLLITLTVTAISYACFHATLAWMETFQAPPVAFGYWLVVGLVCVVTLTGSMSGLLFLYFWYFYSRKYVK